LGSGRASEAIARLSFTWGGPLKNKLSAKLSALVRSPALRAAMMLMAGGFGFAVANILLAKVLASSEFGTVSLFLALIQLTLTLGPFGLDLSINRHRLDASAELRSWGLTTSIVSALLIALAAWALYRVEWAIFLCLVVAGFASSFNRFGTALLQTQQRFGFSLFLGQVHNYVLLLAVPVLWLLGRDEALPIAAMIALSYSITSVMGWRASAKVRLGTGESPPLKSFVRESIAGFGILLATQVLWQLERLVIPRTMTMEDLATFAVVAAIAGSPFRMLQIGVGHTLLPGLRACRSLADVNRLMKHEGAIVFGAAAASVAIVFLVTPFIADHFLMGRYDITTALLVAVVVTGLVKVCNGFVSAIVQAFGSTGTLTKFNVLTWLGLIAGAMCAGYGARYGVTGVVYGVGVAWLAMSVAAAVLAIVALRAWSREPHASDVVASSKSIY
jgi:O-antigen/teichoic acid export membrane protein